MISKDNCVRSISVMLSLNGESPSQSSKSGKVVDEGFPNKGFDGLSGNVAVPVHSKEKGLLPIGLSITIK